MTYYMVGFFGFMLVFMQNIFPRRMSSEVRVAGEVVSFLSSIWFSV